jgi:hypothetical protein
MMRICVCMLLAGALLMSPGCGIFGPATVTPPPKPAPVVANDANSVQNDLLKLKLEIPKRSFVVGEDIRLAIIATNIGARPLVFIHPTSAVYSAVLYRHAPEGWVRVREYPQGVLRMYKTWTLAPGRTVKYDQVIPVSRDWPMDETLKLVVALEGGPDLKCPITFSASAK